MESKMQVVEHHFVGHVCCTRRTSAVHTVHCKLHGAHCTQFMKRSCLSNYSVDISGLLNDANICSKLIEKWCITNFKKLLSTIWSKIWVFEHHSVGQLEDSLSDACFKRICQYHQYIVDSIYKQVYGARFRYISNKWMNESFFNSCKNIECLGCVFCLYVYQESNPGLIKTVIAQKVS